MPYLYKANLSPRDRFNELEFQRDDGSTATIVKGRIYDLTAGEVNRIGAYVELQFTSSPASAEPEGIYQLPVKGTPANGQVPVWNALQGAFVPGSAGSGGSWRSPVATYASLPASSNTIGDVILVIADETIGGVLAVYGWDGDSWQLAAGGGTGGARMSILTGTTAPTGSTGGDGDYYLRATGSEVLIYGPKAAGAWPSGVSLLKRATFQDEGSSLALRDNVNFVGAGVTATDNSGAGRTDVTIPGLAVADEASALPAQPTLNFTGAGVTATNNSGSNRTDVAVSGQLYAAITRRPEDYGAKRDGRMLIDAAMTSGSNILTSPSAPFVSGDVGKIVHVRNAAAGTNVGLTAQIAGFTDASHVTLGVVGSPGTALNAGTTVSGQVAVYGTDDTAAWTAAIAAAVAACQADISYYAEVVGSNGIYMIASAPTLGGGSPDTMGNAQIPLPVVNPFTTGNSKVTLRLGGAHDSATVAHWDQRQPQMSGCVLFSTLMGQTSHATYGVPSVLGGPTIDVQASGPQEVFSNMKLIIDGLYVVTPYNPSYVGIDARRLAQCDVPNLTVNSLAGPDSDSGTPNFSTKPTNSSSVGLYMPKMANNDSANIGVYHCEGFYYGLGFSDHLTAQKLLIVYCDTAMWINNVSGVGVHGSTILYASVEACNRVVDTAATSIAAYPLHIDLLDVEVIVGPYDINDANNSLRGYVGFADPSARRVPRLNGARFLKTVDVMQKRGPALLYNPFIGITAVTNVANAAITTSAAHGLTTGQTVVISGVLGATGANGIWTVTVVDTTHFTINNASGPGTYTSGGTAEVAPPLPKSGGGTTTITGISSANPAVVTAAGHGLSSGQIVTISGVSGAQVNDVNGSFPVLVIDANTFSIPVNTTVHAYGSGGGVVNHAYVPWRDAMVYVAGGTVTAITVDGLVTGITSGAVMVPAGKKIELTYSVAPTWTVTEL
jgi:hypothetical protein